MSDNPTRRYQSPLRGIVIIGTFAILLLLLVLILINQLDPQARAARELTSYQAQAQAERLAWADDLLYVGLRVLLIAAGTIALGIAWRRWGWRESIYADKQTAFTQASVQRFPAKLHTLTYHDRSPATSNAPAISAPASSNDQADDQPAPALTLPDALPLAEILPQLKPGQLCYGSLPSGESLILSFGQAYHALAAGDTRTGKSNYLDAIITQLHHQAQRYDLRLLIGDFKREMAATWQRSPLVEAVEVDPQTIAELLEELAHGEDGILQRYDRFKELGETEGRIIRNLGDYCRVTGQQPRITFAVVDEMNALIEAAGRKSTLESALKIVLQIGAGAGIYVLGGAQYLTAATFGRDGSKQFTTRAVFGAYDHTAARMLFGGGKLAPQYRELLTGQPGRGLIRTAGQAEPIPFQALRCDESDILTAIRLLTDNQPTMPRITTPMETSNDSGKPQTNQRVATEPVTIPLAAGNNIDQAVATQQSPSNAAATATTDCSLDPPTAEIIQRLRANGMGKTKIIELVWGIKAGSNARYRAASAAYEEIVGQGTN